MVIRVRVGGGDHDCTHLMKQHGTMRHLAWYRRSHFSGNVVTTQPRGQCHLTSFLAFSSNLLLINCCSRPAHDVSPITVASRDAHLCVDALSDRWLEFRWRALGWLPSPVCWAMELAMSDTNEQLREFDTIPRHALSILQANSIRSCSWSVLLGLWSCPINEGRCQNFLPIGYSHLGVAESSAITK
jgi:hypothetical protein